MVYSTQEKVTLLFSWVYVWLVGHAEKTFRLLIIYLNKIVNDYIEIILCVDICIFNVSNLRKHMIINLKGLKNSCVKKYLINCICFSLTHSEDHVTVECDIKTMNIEDFNEISLADVCNQNRIVINANLFTELLNRLDNLADELKVILSPNPPYFSLIATGIAVF